MSTFRRTYGASPLHAIAALAGLSLSAWALLHLLDMGERTLNVALWFGGAVVLHDLVALPLYSALDRLAGRALGRPAAINHVRVPAILSGLLLLVWFPLILGLNADTYEPASGMDSNAHLGRWLAITGALFVASGLLYALRARRWAR